MRIKKIKLTNNYKRFADLTIDLGENPKRVVALVGPNGCGKSSVFDGLMFLHNSYGQTGNKGPKDFRYHSMKSTKYSRENILVTFTAGEYETVRQTKVEQRNDRTIFSFRSSYRYNNDLNVTETKAIPELRLNNYGASTSIDLDDKMDVNYRRLNIFYSNYLNNNDCRPSEAKRHIIDALNQSLAACLDLQISSLGNVEEGKGTLYFTKSDQQQEFNFNLLSAGEKEVVDIILDLYLRKDEYNDTVFLIDEPELHINTSIQRALLIEINKLIGPDCQLWIATHSIGFLRALQEELKDDCQIIEFKPDVPWATQSIDLEPIKANRANWHSIFQTALDDLTTLIAPKRIIYCEGLDRPGSFGTELGFDARVFNQIFSEKYNETVFVSSGGNTELDQRSEIALAILSKVWVDLQILVLKDRDISSGRLTTENDRKVHLQNSPENHRVLRRYEIENYLFDKEILKQYCAAKTLTFDETAYDGFVTDIVNQNIKDETNRIKNFCGINTNVNSEKFKISLSEFVTPETVVFQELEKCVFNRDL